MKEKVLLLLILVYFIHSVDAFGDEEIIFLHHSTGNNVYNYPALGVSQWFSNYNLAEGTSYQINEASYPTTPYPWNNYPYDYWHLWVDGYCDNGQSGIRCLDYFTTNYDVVIWKHCYPGSDIFQEAATGIPSDRTIENYKSQYRLFRAEMDNYPNTKFIVWTIPPRREADTNLGNAQRTVQFTNWVKNEWLTEGGEQHPNIYLFDFRSIVSDSNGYYLKPEYESADSHPNADANNIAGPLFAEFIVGVTNVDVTNNGELIWKEDFEDQSYTDTFSTHESSTTCAEGSNGYDSLSVTDYQSQNGYYSLRFDSCSIAIDPVTGLDGCENINLYLGTLTGSTVGGTSHDFSSIETTNEIYVKYWTRYDNAIPLSEEYLEIGAYDFNDNGYVAFDENSPSQYPLSAKTRDSGWNIIDYTNPLSPLNIYDGNWHKMEYHINYDYNELGEASVSGWIDDQLVLDWQNIITPGTPDYIRVHKFLEGASECTSSPVQIDDIEVWDGIPNLAQCADGEIFSLCECGGSARDYGYCLANEWATNPIISCTINDAYWSETNVDVGTQVDLIVIGTNCDGRTVNFQILEHDAIIGNYDDVTSQLNNPPNEATFSGNTATVSWISEWVEDNGGIDDDPEYVFIASLSDDLSEFRLSNNELKVNFIEIICTDDDEDNYYVETSSCEAEPGFLGHNDCDDNNEQIYPANVNGYCDCVTDWGDNFDIGAPIDFCEDGIDQNCNGMDETCLANELIVDNDDTSISFSGSWSGGGGYLGKYGDYYHYSAIDPTNWFEWTIDLTSLGAGQYEVYTSWNELSTRPSDVSYDITHSSGTDNLPKDQTLLGSGGVWNYLGTYSFGSTAVVRLNDGTTGSDGSSADAVRFLKISSGCLEDSDCNELDGDDFCFGTEVRHTEGICNASFECEAQTSIVEDCNDGLFCNGLESCNAASCVDGTSPIIEDGIGCTDDSCDEINDVIVNYPNDSLCDDGDEGTIDNCSVVDDCIFTPIITIVDQTIDLNEGWNLVSLNINTSNSSSDLGAVFVMRYGDNSWETDWGIFYEDEFGLDPLRGYYVFSGSDQSLTFSGQELGLDYSLVNNTWNLFSVHSSDSFDSIYETSLESGELMQVVLSDGSFVYSDVSEDLNPGSLYWAKIGDAQFGPVVQSTGFFQGIIDTIMYLFKVNS